MLNKNDAKVSLHVFCFAVGTGLYPAICFRGSMVLNPSALGQLNMPLYVPRTAFGWETLCSL